MGVNLRNIKNIIQNIGCLLHTVCKIGQQVRIVAHKLHRIGVFPKFRQRIFILVKKKLQLPVLDGKISVYLGKLDVQLPYPTLEIIRALLALFDQAGIAFPRHIVCSIGLGNLGNAH